MPALDRKLDKIALAVERRYRWILAGLVVGFIALSAGAASQLSYCFEEVENGVLASYQHVAPVDALASPLLQYTYGLPYYWLQPDFPYPLLEKAKGNVPDFKERLRFAHLTVRRSNPSKPLLEQARFIGTLLTSSLILLTFFWGKSIAGVSGGLGAAFLTATCPQLIAHGGLISTDTLNAVTFMAALWALTAWPWWRKSENLAFVGELLGVTILVGGMGFYLHIRQDLPFSKADEPLYFLGGWHTGGLWLYYPVALLVKTPILWFLLFAWAAVEWLLLPKEHRHHIRSLLGAATLLLAFFMVTASHPNGIRDLLILYPMIAVLCAPCFGKLTAPLELRRRKAVLLLVPLLAFPLAFQFPYYLESINLPARLFGPPEYYFTDSNTDWGQGLKGLSRWMKKNAPGETVKLAYYGMDDPAAYGLSYQPLPTWDFLPWLAESPEPVMLCRTPQDLAPGLYALSPIALVQEGKPLPCLEPFRHQEPIAHIGRSLLIYRR